MREKKSDNFFQKPEIGTPHIETKVINQIFIMSCQNSFCSGCTPYNQPNQLAHMGLGGCLYVDDSSPQPDVSSDNDIWDTDSEEDQDQDQDQDQEQKQVPPFESPPPLFESPIPLGECPICYEELNMINITVTECGHTFHASCVFKAMERTVDCPMCRHQLLEVPEEEEEDEDDYDEEEVNEEQDEGEEQDDEEEDEAPQVTVEQLTSKLLNMGYTAEDFVGLFMNQILKRQNESRGTDEFIETMNDKIDDIVEGRITLAHRDQRSYAQVASQQQQPQQQPVQVKDLERALLQRLQVPVPSI
jgi:uncharacterized protein YbaR (Trm112 family)